MDAYLNSQKCHHNGVDGPQDAFGVVGHRGVIKYLNKTEHGGSTRSLATKMHTTHRRNISFNTLQYLMGFIFTAEMHCPLAGIVRILPPAKTARVIDTSEGTLRPRASHGPAPPPRLQVAQRHDTPLTSV